ncbi:hypothetical protein ACHAXR_001195 [Thalassiosira sp. AJA248-18]
MTGIQLSITDVPAPSTDTASWSKEQISHLQQADIACFENMSIVQSYLQKLDDYWGVAEDMSDEDRRKLSNKPDAVGDILGRGAPVPSNDATFMAACPNASTARECLNSGRWMTNHIYYPKDTQKAVELKTEPLAGQNDDEGNGEEVVQEDEEIDMEIWADSIVQAAGDVMERKFWGGGW